MNARNRRAAIAVGATVLATSLAACGGGGGAADGGTVEIEFLTQDGGTSVPLAEAMIEAFQTANPDVVVKLQTQPGGTEGDNLTKTKLSTQEMSDVFTYNSGSLLQALNPDQTLVPLSDQPWVGDLSEDFAQVVSTPNGLYGAPVGTSRVGAVMYNRALYEELGLEVPTSWSEFMANNETIAAEAPDVAPIIQTYGDTWTSQLFVLGDFANVQSADPQWAAEYTAGNRSYAEEPGLAGFRHQQEAFEADLFNEDFPSATFENGLRMLAEGEGAHYPMLTDSISTIQQNNPDAVDDIGVFALPADDAANTAITVWQPNAIYIPSTTEDEKLEAAKRFVTFFNSPEGCAVQSEVLVPGGPFVTSACPAPEDAPPIIADIQEYFDSGATTPALEFLSPIKGPNLENITVAVGSGITSAADGAAQYDEDVRKQAQQLGLEGW
ncbi:extracellular solute-binding protein [Auraticoccus sp. F435]|uniref:Extracellular solute-binding protein n=1 Tax=Auraticoccus cholistanensis TaxID=2656650 RepID=A0A6A9V1U5_9ACTN|nr:ABC transporter substrate-binding protein [Auraticoccus cholistanensis]MVA77547.1 extracellular solute-binding protein [Auraticoccus cholistanensis]